MLISEYVIQHIQVFIIKRQHFKGAFPYSILFLEIHGRRESRNNSRQHTAEDIIFHEKHISRWVVCFCLSPLKNAKTYAHYCAEVLK